MKVGKGSDKHKKIQKDIQDMLRGMGYIAVIEPAFDGRNADLLAQNLKTLETTVIEIELYKNYSHAIQSINSDLKFSDNVLVFCENETILIALSRLSGKFDKKDRQRIHFYLINQYAHFIRILFQNKNNNTTYNTTQNNIRINRKSSIKSLTRETEAI